MCMYGYVQGSTVHPEYRGAEWLGTGVDNHLMWELGMGLVSYTRAGCDLKGWAISPAPVELNHTVRFRL